MRTVNTRRSPVAYNVAIVAFVAMATVARNAACVTA